MKNKIKKIWVSPITIMIMAAQVVVAIVEHQVPDVVFFVSMFINFVAMAVVNYNIYWLSENNKQAEADKYRTEAGCNFNGLKFSVGLIILVAVALIAAFHPINPYDALNYIIKWYATPFMFVWFSKYIAKAVCLLGTIFNKCKCAII